VSVQYSILPPPPDPNQKSYGEIKGVTDTNGIFSASHTDRSWGLAIIAEESGYYTAHIGHELYVPGQMDEKTVNASRDFEQILLLKKIGKPIPMYARNAQIEIPEINKPIGFDLVEYDWVAPYGKGKQSDLIFTAQRRWVSRQDFDSSLKIAFANSGDGLIPVATPLNQGSELRMPATAPADDYISEISKSLSHTPANGWKDNEREGNKEQNYYFRVRTVLDEKGSVKSALYGKIYNDFALDPINSKTMTILFTYYLNPKLNSRNVEFDPKQNLSKDLKMLEGVNAP
jgi:hypothetical protein